MFTRRRRKMFPNSSPFDDNSPFTENEYMTRRGEEIRNRAMENLLNLHDKLPESEVKDEVQELLRESVIAILDEDYERSLELINEARDIYKKLA